MDGNFIYILTPYKKNIIIECNRNNYFIKRDDKYKVFKRDNDNTNDRYFYNKNGILCYKIVYKRDLIQNQQNEKINKYLRYYIDVDTETQLKKNQLNKDIKKNTIIRIPYLLKNFIKKKGQGLNENDYNNRYFIIAIQSNYNNIKYIVENYKFDYNIHKKKYKIVLDELLLEVNKYLLRPDNIKYYIDKYGVENFEDYI